MDVITTPGAVDANSYVSIAEADVYLTSRDGFSTDSWRDLSEEQKAVRLFYGACVIDSLKFRGRKLCRGQALCFPRSVEGTHLYAAGSPFSDMESAQDFAALFGEAVPVIPEKVKFAQIEAAFQIVHSHMFRLGAFESGEAAIASLSIDVIRMSFEKSPVSANTLFSAADFGAVSTIKLLLQDFLSGVRGDVV